MSWVCAIGMIPERPTRPTVGFSPTRPFTDDGQTIEPLVSVPIAPAQKFAEAAAPDPEDDPHGLRSSAYGFAHWPPRPLQPEDELVDRKLAHSLRFALPRMIAPAARSRAATHESCAGIEPSSAREPAVVVIRSAVSTLSFTTIGTPCSGPRSSPDARSASSSSARASASGFVSIMERRRGPSRSIRAIRSR